MGDISQYVNARAIIAEILANGWSGSADNTAGTLTQSVVWFPLGEYGGYMVCLQFIFGTDTDADANEAVTFYDDFDSFLGVWSLGNDAVGSSMEVKTASATGFTYSMPTSNRGVFWFAAGIKQVAL